MRRRSVIIFLLLNVLVSMGVAYAVITTVNNNQTSSAQPIVITVPVIMTATNAPATPNVVVITATLPPGVVQLPTGIIEEVQGAQTRLPLPTLNETLAAESGSSEQLVGTSTALPTNCVPYVVQSGDFPTSIAEQYGINYFDLMAVNGLDDTSASNLQIGQVLIVPLEGCELTAASISQTETATLLPSPTPVTPSLTPSVTPTPSNTPLASNTPQASNTPASSNTPQPSATRAQPTNTPVPTIPPTAANAQVQISSVLAPGDLNSEGVQIRNSSNATVDLSGWTLRDAAGIIYTFPAERRLFGGGTLIVFTRQGDDTPVALYWDQSAAVWASGETMTLLNASGQAQSTFRVP